MNKKTEMNDSYLTRSSKEDAEEDDPDIGLSEVFEFMKIFEIQMTI